MTIKMGSLFIVAAPSGGGKTSLVKHLARHLDNLAVSISHTTREIRTGEEDGVDYFFVDELSFLKMVENAEFVEHAKVFNHFYGTSEAQIKDRLKAGVDVLLDIDWQGAQQIRNTFANTVSIFIIPPSLETLQKRLFTRKRDNAIIIKARMDQAKEELSHYGEFDYLIVNDDFEKASEELAAIVIAHRLRIERQVQEQQEVLSFLLNSK